MKPVLQYTGLRDNAMKKLSKKSTVKEYKPKPERDVAKFKKNTRWVMLVEYRPDIVNRRYQKFLFKTETSSIKEATKEAERQARIIGKAICISLKELQEVTLCRVVAVYAEDVFESWKKEPGLNVSKDHIDKAKNLVKYDPATKEIKKISKVKVR